MHAVRVLGGEIRSVRLSDVVERDRAIEVVNIHEQSHLSTPLSVWSGRSVR